VLLIEGERERLIPFIESVVVSVDVAGGSLVVDWDADF
jgi:ribosomal 30S subunit maturation factor RimM